jgi:glycosyltransferase involved in cell wall biosynthesis
MKVLFITSSGAPDGMYGGSVALYNLILGLQKKIECVFVFPESGYLEQSLKKLNYKCYVIPKYGLNWYPAHKTFRQVIEFIPRILRMVYKRNRALKNISKIIEMERPDIIHTNVGPLDLGHVLALKYKIPHVWHIREYQDLDFGAAPFPSMKSFRKKIKKSNNHLLSITKDVFKYFQMSPEKDEVIYDGVFPIKECYETGIKRNYFLFVGSLKAAKGIDHLLEAYAAYLEQNGKIPLKVVGAGGTKLFSEKLAKICRERHLGTMVEFCGFRNDVYDLMRNAKALVVPSRFEGFGFIVAEAMYNGCLVIGHNTGGIKEQFDNGVAYTGAEIGLRYDTTEQLVTYLHNIEKNEKYYDDVIKRAFKTANDLYNLERSASDVLSFFQSCIKKFNSETLS